MSKKIIAMNFFLSCFTGVFLIGYSFTACQDSKDGASANDSLIRTVVNGSFDIKLEACLTCGYDWFPEPLDTSAIKLLDKSSQPNNPDPNMVGGNAIVTWRFVALKPGNYILVFNYKRPWMEEIQNTEKIRVIVAKQNATQAGTTNLKIMVPENDSVYRTAMTRYAQEGGENPLVRVRFVKKEVVVPSVTDIIRASAQAAAEHIYPAFASAGSPGVDSVVYLKVQNDTAYILLGMDIDGWAGVSVATAIVHPVVEKTLLQFPEIRHVVFGKIPG